MGKQNEDFYAKMQEAKRRKKLKLEQEQLAAEFKTHPERFVDPHVKSEMEQKIDQAFMEIRIKLGTVKPVDKIQKAFDNITKNSEGL
jgi:hypothetical protein